MTLKRNSNVIGTVSAALFLSCATTCFGQSLGDIARQERERKEQEPRRSTYVYTNDDLKKPHILVPEDQQRVLARKKEEATPVDASNLPTPVLQSPIVPYDLSSLLIGPTAINLELPLETSSQKPVIPDAPAPPTDAVEPPSVTPISRRSRTANPPAISMSLAISEPLAAPAFPVLSPKTETVIVIREQAASAVESPKIAPTSALRALPWYATPAQQIAPPSVSRELQAAHASVSQPVATPVTLRELQPAPVTVSVHATYRVATSPVKTMNPTQKAPTLEIQKPTVSGEENHGLSLTHFTQPAEHLDNQPDIRIDLRATIRKAKSKDAIGGLGIRVERGDSLWRLAEKHLGSGKRWREVAALNPNLANPNLIRVGEWIKLPEA